MLLEKELFKLKTKIYFNKINLIQFILIMSIGYKVTLLIVKLQSELTIIDSIDIIKTRNSRLF